MPAAGSNLSRTDPGTSTVPVVADLPTERRSHLVRRLALGVLAALVLVGLTGTLGVRARTATAEAAGGLRAELTYPHVARPGLAVPFRLVIARPGGFPAPVEVRVSRAWLESFDENGLIPEPDAATTDGPDVVWTFDPPPGTVFTVALDTRVEPGLQWRRRGTTTVTTGDERLSVDHTMWVLP